MKKYAYTYLPTIKTYSGENITFNEYVLTNFIKKTLYENILSLSSEEKNEVFHMCFEYRELLEELFDAQIKNITKAGWTLDDEYRNPTEEYENYISLPKDDDLTDEEHNLKIEFLRQFKEWFETQNN